MCLPNSELIENVHYKLIDEGVLYYSPEDLLNTTVEEFSNRFGDMSFKILTQVLKNVRNGSIDAPQVMYQLQLFLAYHNCDFSQLPQGVFFKDIYSEFLKFSDIQDWHGKVRSGDNDNNHIGTLGGENYGRKIY